MAIVSFRSALAVLLVALGVYFFFLRPAPVPWHSGEKWALVHSLYNESVSSSLAKCERRYLPTRFGSTHVYLCGKENPAKAPVLFLHGAGSNSMIYAKWVVPKIVDSTLAILVDYPCDIGWSSPLNGDIANCPQTRQELHEWVKSVLSLLKINRPVSMVGYSYGAFTSAVAVKEEPAAFSKLVTIAPASVFAPISTGWIMRAILYGIVPGRWFFDYMSANKEVPYLDTLSEFDRKFAAAIADLSASLAVPADPFSDEELRALNEKVPTLLVIGESETVTDSNIAIEAAKRAGIKVELLKKAGHLLLVEAPANQIAEKVVVDFLLSP